VPNNLYERYDCMEQMKQEIENRIAIYALISRLMLVEVDKTFLMQLESDENMLALFPNYKAWKKRETLSVDTLIEEEYNADFTNLFLMNLIPYESFYLSEEQMIESGDANPVVELYDALDFRVELEKARVVSADHIGVELEFMYMLCTALKKAFDSDDQEGVCELLLIQKGFLKDHLLAWMPLFLINAKRESRTPLYHDGTELTLEFILSDYEYVIEQLDRVCKIEVK